MDSEPCSIITLESQPDEEDFVQKYGSIDVKYIKRPKVNTWFVNKPYALNFFHHGTLYRTHGERGESSKMELFFDLMYVGIVAKLAATATSEPNGLSLLKYVLLFCPVWQIWSDVRDLMNYYFAEDLIQKILLLWILVLLIVYTNATNYILESNKANAYVIVPYMLSRLSTSLALLIAGYYVPQHRTQDYLYASLTIVTVVLWIPVIFVPVRVKIGLAFMNIFLEYSAWIVSYHPNTKRLMGLKYSTALNIEHEVERFGAFIVIAIGEFSYSVAATTIERNFGFGITEHLGRAIMLEVIAYDLLWIYFEGDGSAKAEHAMRRSGNAATAWFFAHMPLAASLVLAADAAADMCYEDELEEVGLKFYFTGGISLTIVLMLLLAILDRTLDEDPDERRKHRLPKAWRLAPRLPVAAIILGLSWSDLGITQLFATVMALLTAMFTFEVVSASDPENCSDVSSRAPDS